MIKINITYKSVLEGTKSVEKRNKIFAGLTDEGKRLEIAWDALKLLIGGIIHAEGGVYWSNDLDHSASNLSSGKELQEFLNRKDNIGGCDVCARGAVMLSMIRLGNSVEPNDFCKTRGSEKNSQGFSLRSMIKMEREFENCGYDHPYEDGTGEKLANILCNVLVNGDFNPEDSSDYLINS